MVNHGRTIGEPFVGSLPKVYLWGGLSAGRKIPCLEPTICFWVRTYNKNNTTRILSLHRREKTTKVIVKSVYHKEQYIRLTNIIKHF